jgi:predicted aminopeptidase
MKDFTHRDLTELVIHEIIHSIIFIKNNFDFNEGLAEFIGNEGARLYIEGLEAPPPDDVYDKVARADRANYLAHVLSVIDELDAVYSNHELTTKEKLELKSNIIALSQNNFRNTYDNLFVTNVYKYYPSLPVNNAYYDLYRLYHGKLVWFKELYEKSGSDLQAFIAAARTVKCTQDPFSEFELALFKEKIHVCPTSLPVLFTKLKF